MEVKVRGWTNHYALVEVVMVMSISKSNYVRWIMEVYSRLGWVGFPCTLSIFAPNYCIWIILVMLYRSCHLSQSNKTQTDLRGSGFSKVYSILSWVNYAEVAECSHLVFEIVATLCQDYTILENALFWLFDHTTGIVNKQSKLLMTHQSINQPVLPCYQKVTDNQFSLT